MLDVGPHTHHVDVEITHEDQVIGQVFPCLERYPDHHPGAGLVANLL